MGRVGASSYEVTSSNGRVSSECPGQTDESIEGQSERTSAGSGVKSGLGTRPNADQFSLRSGGPSAAYLNPRCRIGGPYTVRTLSPEPSLGFYVGRLPQQV
jgi:hypothetical protein